MDVFALAMYGLVIFPKSTRYVESMMVDLIEQVCKQCNPIPFIIVETFRSLSFCHKKGKGDFIGCVQSLYVWLRSHFRERIR